MKLVDKRHGDRGPASGARRILAGALLAAVLTALALAGCSVGNPHAVGTYERGAFYAERGKHLEAATAFEAYVRRNPTDSLAAEAQFHKAVAYLELGEYPLAAVEFQILRKDYPTSARVEEALFREGIAYLNQVGRIERDATGAHQARLHFLEFSQEYPASVHLPEVVQYMQDISDLMVRKRLAQIKVYRQLHQFDAVAVTLDDVLREESGSTLIPEVLWERARAAERLGDEEGARRFYETLVGEHPDSPLAPRAQRQLPAAAES